MATPDSASFRSVADGFLTRVQMINAAERTLDLQYFIFAVTKPDNSLHARVLVPLTAECVCVCWVDDGETVAGDDQISMLAAHPSVEIRLFNPFALSRP